jgi:hypothetical protein
MIDLYVYYKVRENTPTASRRWSRPAGPGDPAGHARQLRRPESKDGLQTWMEVYPDVPDALPPSWKRPPRAAGFEGLIEGPRRVEVFTEFPPCA